MIWNNLTKNDVLIYKGIAILMIVIHNFLHRFPKPQENEMTFDPVRINDFFSIIVNEPGGSVRAIFSFFGHFGVQIFIFLSAYGLSKKYANDQDEYFTFLKSRMSKLYPSFLLAILAYIIYVGVIENVYLGAGLGGLVTFWESSYTSILLKLTLLSNFIPDEGFALVGPWWFMSLIFQFYLFFPILLKLNKKYGNSALVLISVFSIIIMQFTKGEIFNVSGFFLLIGHLPVFCLGMYFANKQRLSVSKIFLVIAVILFSLGNVYKEFWLISHACFLIVLLFLLHKLVPFLLRFERLKKVVTFYGVISLPLFLLNGFLRAPWIQFARSIDNELLSLVFCALFLLISTISAYIFMFVESRINIKFLGRK